MLAHPALILTVAVGTLLSAVSYPAMASQLVGHETKLTPPYSPQPSGDRFGWSVAIDGNTMVVGAPFSDYVAVSSGGALVYQRRAGVWRHAATLFISDGMRKERAGTSVAISGSSIVVGCPVDWLQPYDIWLNGRAFVFCDTSEARDWSSWSRTELIDPLQQAKGFGTAVAIDRSTIIVGAASQVAAPCYSPAPPDSVAIFTDSSTAGDWSSSTSVAIEGLTGSSVAVAGRIAVVGEGHRAGCPVAGAWVLRDTSAGGDWTDYTKVELVPADDPGALFGYSVDISGSTIIVGRGGAHVHLFLNTSPDNDWASYIETTLRQPRASRESREWFGYSVAIRGEEILIGAPSFSPDAIGPGAAYLFTCLIPGVWGTAQVTTITPPEAECRSRFGNSVELDSVSVAVGSPYDTSGGAVYLYTGSDMTQKVQLGEAADSAPQLFGHDVAGDGDTVVIAASVGDGVQVYRREQHRGVLRRSLPIPEMCRADWSDRCWVDISGSSILISTSEAVCLLHDTSWAGDWSSYSEVRLPHTGVATLSGSTVAVVSPGSLYLYHDTGAGDWREYTEIRLTAPNTPVYSPAAVDGRTVVANGGDEDRQSCTLHVYQDTSRNGDWSSHHRATLLVDADPVSRLAISGANSVAVVPFVALDHPPIGYAYVVHDTSREGDWSSYATHRMTAGDTGDSFGYGMSVAMKERVVVVGSPVFYQGTICPGTGVSPGAGLKMLGDIYVFHDTSAAGDWTSHTLSKLSAPQPHDQFGMAVAVTETSIVVGAPEADGGAGAVYLFPTDARPAPRRSRRRLSNVQH